ncbi:MAG: ABC transporter permease [Desulfurococcaceae archaeon]
MRIVILRRKKEIKYNAIISSCISVLFGIAIYLFILWLFNVNLVDAIVILGGSFISPTIVKDFLIICLIGCGLIISFKASIWNIGGEGQFYVAMIPGIILTLIVFNPEESNAGIPSVLVIILVIITGALAGAAWATIAGVLKAYMRVDEVPVTLILNYIAYYLLNYLVSGPLKGKKTYGYLRTDEIPGLYRLNIVLSTPQATSSFEGALYGFMTQVAYYLAVLIAVILVFTFIMWMFKYTKLGLYIKILGANPDYLLTSGANVKVLTLCAMALSGSIVGLTGSLYLLVEWGRIPYGIQSHTPGYGYQAILASWLSMLDYRFLPVSAYLVAGLRNTGLSIKIAGLGDTEQSLIILGSFLLAYSITRFISDYEVKFEW